MQTSGETGDQCTRAGTCVQVIGGTPKLTLMKTGISVGKTSSPDRRPRSEENLSRKIAVRFMKNPDFPLPWVEEKAKERKVWAERGGAEYSRTRRRAEK